MKNIILLRISVLLAFLTLGDHVFCQIQTFQWQGNQRQYLVRTPSENSESTPILFFLHGLGDNITNLDNEFHFQQLANQYSWTVVVPQAMSVSGYTMWNAGLMASSIDDSGFLMALLDTVAEHYPIDLDSVFFTGFSMGGFMTHRMAIEHGDRITACAPVSGLITNSMANLSAVPVRMLHIHGTADPVVGYDGGSQYFGMNLGLGVDAILEYWKNANGCVDEPVIDTFPDLKNDGLLFVRYKYEGNEELQHIKVIGGDHSWYMDDNQFDINYMTEIYKFFTYKEGGNVGLVEPEQDALKLWPNPTSGSFTIQAEAATTVEVIDTHGRCVAMYALHPGSNQIDMGDLSEGLYFVKDGNGSVRKIMLAK